jgi:hypothetical protein
MPGRVLSREPLPTGMTLVRVDLAVDRIAQIQVLTAIAHTLTDDELAAMVDQSAAVIRPPLGRR